MKTETELTLQALIAIVTNVGIFPVASIMLRRKMASFGKFLFTFF
jgi:hypothetical protein